MRTGPNIVQGESERKQIAEQIAAYIREVGLTQPFGGDVSRSERKGRSLYVVSFARPRTLDGLVEVWGKTFIRIVSQGPAELPATVCKSVDKVLEFIRKGWVDYEREDL